MASLSTLLFPGGITGGDQGPDDIVSGEGPWLPGGLLCLSNPLAAGSRYKRPCLA